MVRILIIGFQRSGTTLLRRIVSYHPDIIQCFHETKLLNNNDFDFNIDGNFGEKIPYYEKDGKFIIDYVNRWFKKFGKDARIVHIIRNSKSVIDSNVRTFGKVDEQVKILHDCSVPIVDNKFKNDKRYFKISFESLVTNPLEECIKIFNHCDLDHSKETVKKIISPGKDKWRYFNNINPNRA